MIAMCTTLHCVKFGGVRTFTPCLVLSTPRLVSFIQSYCLCSEQTGKIN